MTVRFPTIAAAVAAAACLATPSVAATAAMEAGRQPVHARIAYGDLDLSRPAGRATMKARIDRAVRRACTSSLPRLSAMGDTARCRDEMLRDADVQVAAIPGSMVEVAARR